MLDSLQQGVVDGDQDPQGWAGIGVDEGQEGEAGLITMFGMVCERFEEFALVEGHVVAVARAARLSMETP